MDQFSFIANKAKLVHLNLENFIDVKTFIKQQKYMICFFFAVFSIPLKLLSTKHNTMKLPA